jgi:hypothetical protein
MRNVNSILIIVLIFFIAGCAATSTINAQTTQSQTRANFVFVDSRPEREKLGQSEHPSDYVKVYSDEMINPKPPALVQSTLQRQLNQSLEGKSVQLNSFVVSVMGAGSYGGVGHIGVDGAVFAILFAPLVASVAVDSAIDNSNANQSVITNIEIELDKKLYYGGAVVDHKGRISNKELSKCTEQALSALVDNIKSRMD